MDGVYLPENTTPVVAKTKNKTEIVLKAKEEEKTITKEQFKEMIREALQRNPEIQLSEEERNKFTALLHDDYLQDRLYEIIKREKIWSLYNILLSLLSGALY